MSSTRILFSLLLSSLVLGCGDYEIRKKSDLSNYEKELADLKSQLQESQVNTRYQIYFSPHMRIDTYLLDSQTGRSWRPIQYNDLEGRPTVWKEVFREDNLLFRSERALSMMAAHPFEVETPPPNAPKPDSAVSK